MEDKRLQITIQHWGNGKRLEELKPVEQSFILSTCNSPEEIKYINCRVPIGPYSGIKLSALRLDELQALAEDEEQTVLLNKTVKYHLQTRKRNNMAEILCKSSIEEQMQALREDSKPNPDANRLTKDEFIYAYNRAKEFGETIKELADRCDITTTSAHSRIRCYGLEKLAP